MKFAILVDYANLYITVQKNLKLTVQSEIEMQVCRVLERLDNYLASTQNESGRVTVVKRVGYVLDDHRLGDPEQTLASCGYAVKLVRDELSAKTDEMRRMNQSRRDDEALMADAIEMADGEQLDGILVITNDGDYSSLGEKLNYAGRYFWVGIFEGVQRAAWRLRNIADLVLPLHDIINDVDEAEPLPMTESDRAASTQQRFEPHLVFYRHGEVMLTYPIYKEVIEIGRRSSSRFHFPQIDLTDYDEEKVVSRQHLTIRRVKGEFLLSVHEKCSRGTWGEGMALHPCEQLLLRPGMQFVIGDRDGFGMEYASGDKGRVEHVL